MAKVIKDIKFEQLLEIYEKESENGKSKTVLQVVRWGDNPPTLEKRNYFWKDDDWFCGKQCGMTKKDFIKCVKAKDEIKQALTEE